ncbi:drug resistance transporter, EmrB/QacA subfamily [Streptomyces zhaozhouensis]|uniref:Drug resistance transporter, EmrB/QacA subfamily n=1 Tax=Streptomyces zhaozhouensis TaxID=1300267 RepID=A0A286DXZ7_9ACTN|nr:MFS transporter [Streptomyces zhaozhouensis]SOD63535.1 drug resistance transporter, EmrB/QacA subfamily [Streptomyces zhaozhouensis]
MTSQNAALDKTPPLGADPRRWQALFYIALAQLMVVLDGTIVNIALPTAQEDLGISAGNRQWVITAYALAFGGLLLFGGRIADLWGRQRTFITGLVGFALASGLGGAAQNELMMYGARALQGVFGALLAPAALSLLTVMFTDARERAKAFGVFGAISGAGAAVGLLLGGALTEYLDWRWTFYVNVPFAVVAIVGAVTVIREPAEARNRSTLDVPGVLLATLGLVALVYGFSRAEHEDWTETWTVASFVASAVLLITFVLVESRVKAPLLPLRVVTDRNRGGTYLAFGLSVIAMFGLFLFLTLYLQMIRGYSPVETGLAFLPMVVGMVIGSTQIAPRLTTRFAPRYLMGSGLVVASLGMLWLTQLDLDSSYAGVILPAQLLLGLGMGTNFMAGMSLATSGVRPTDAGVASAMVNTAQQIGGAIGTALLNTIAASASSGYLASRIAGTSNEAEQLRLGLESEVHGYSVAIWWAFAIVATAAVIAFTLINAPRSQGQMVTGDGEADQQPAPVMAH